MQKCLTTANKINVVLTSYRSNGLLTCLLSFLTTTVFMKCILYTIIYNFCIFKSICKFSRTNYLVNQRTVPALYQVQTLMSD